MGRIVVVGVICLGLAACAADAVPLERDVVVQTAGPTSPVAVGTPCVLRMRPAARYGVNCRLLLRCTTAAGTEDLYGGARVGGYADCETEDQVFTAANDDEHLVDGDPALIVDVPGGTLSWRGAREGEEATLRIRERAVARAR